MLKIAGFDDFIVKYCTTQYNTLCSIGAFFIFQLIAIFISIFILFYDFFYCNILISFFFSIATLLLFSKKVSFFLKLLHKQFNMEILIVILFINLLILTIITSIFNLKIFETEIYYDLILNGNNYGKYKIYKYFVSLLHQIKNSENSMVIILFSIAIFLLLQFIFIKPYFQIYSTRKTLYNTIRKNYEQNFKSTDT